MGFRRRVTSDDTVILGEKDVAWCWSTMMHEWLETGLRQDQRNAPSCQKSSIFNAFVKRTYARKHFVLAVFECGFAWFPDAHLISASEHVATERIMSAFCAWLLEFVDAVERHKNRPETRKAQLNLGKRKRRSGLEEKERDARDAGSAAKRLQCAWEHHGGGMAVKAFRMTDPE